MGGIHGRMPASRIKEMAAMKRCGIMCAEKNADSIIFSPGKGGPKWGKRKSG
jgi:hypothetical protein